MDGLLWDQGASRGKDNLFLKIEEAGGCGQQQGLSPRASTTASSRFKHCCSMQAPCVYPNASSDTHLGVNSNHSGTKSQHLQNKKVGRIDISRRSSNSMRVDVITHSFNNIIENQETQRPGAETVLTLEDNAPSDYESDSVSNESMNVMISKAQRDRKSVV